MLSGVEFPERYAEWLDHIKSADVKAAFVYIVGMAACAKNFDCHPQLKGGGDGPVHDFRFHDRESGEQWFSFSANVKKPLLFYFRKPATDSKCYSWAAVAESFPELYSPPSRPEEWVVRLTTVSDVQRLWAILKID